MKKLVLLSFLGCSVLGVHAQSGMGGVKPLMHKALQIQKGVEVNHHSSNTAAKGTSVVSRWYDASISQFVYENGDLTTFNDTDHLYFIPMWQDSSVTYTGSTDGISDLSIGNVFHPQSPLFNDMSINPGEALYLNNVTPYHVDSVQVLGFYNRTQPGVDTMIFSFLAEHNSNTFIFFSYGGTTFADHNVDSFAVQLWDGGAYLAAPINQIPYNYGSVQLDSFYQIKVPMNDATFADSTPNGLHWISVAPNFNVTAGSKVSVSITFKSGSAYTPGTEITNYNFFMYETRETNPGGYVSYVGGDQNMSSVVLADTVNTQVVPADTGGNALNIYIPSIGFTAPYVRELHEIEWKISADPVGINSVATGINANAYPNPANNLLTVPVSLVNAGNVVVTLTNTMGQVIATQDLGKVAAGQSATAKFNTSGVASGVYFYTVESNGKHVTERVNIAH